MNVWTLAFLLFSLAPFGCAVESRQKPPLERLQTMWRYDLSMRRAFKPHKQQLAQQLFERERISVRDTTGEEAFKLIDGELRWRKGNSSELILTGDLATLRKQSKLTEIYNPGTFLSGFAAYLTPDGDLILLWITPEG